VPKGSEKVPKGVRSDGGDGEHIAQKVALIEGLRRIWHSDHISGVQATLDALDQLVGFMGDDVWDDITGFVAKMGESGSKKALLSFVVGRIGLVGDEWWGVN